MTSVIKNGGTGFAGTLRILMPPLVGFFMQNGHIIAVWAKMDPESALDAAGRIGFLVHRRSILEHAVSSFGEENPAGAVNLLEARPSLGQSRLYAAMFGRWAERDLEGAIGRIPSLGDAVAQREACKAVAATLAKHDPAAAIRWASSIADKYHRNEALSEVVRFSLKRDPAQAAEAFALMEDSSRKGMHVESVTEHLVEEDPAAAVEWVREKLQGAMQDMALGVVVSALAETDRQTAIAVLEEIPRGESRSGAVAALSRTWTATDPDATLAWVEALHGEDRAAAEQAFVRTLVSNDPRAAANYAGNLPESSISAMLLREAARAWAAISPEESVAWAEFLSGSAGRETLKEALRGWGYENPRSAADYISGMESTAARDSLAEGILDSYIRWSPAEVALWVEETLVDPGTRIPAYRSVASRWLETDPVAANEWMGGLPAGAERDAAVEALLLRIEASDPGAAAGWVESLFDPQKREAWTERLRG